MKLIVLKENERIIAVVPGQCSGPGWSNKITWVHIATTDEQHYRSEAIQPRERSPELDVLWECAAEMVAALKRAVPTTINKD